MEPVTSADSALRDVLIRDPAAGWRAFVDRYTPSMLSFIERAGISDRGEAMELFMRACERLSSDGCIRLRRHDPATEPLAEWLPVLMRNVLVDWVRSRAGRRRVSRAVQALSITEQDVFDLFYWRDRTPSEISDILTRRTGRPVPLERVLDALDAIERALAGAHQRELLALAARARGGRDIHGGLDRAVGTLPPEDAAIARLKYVQGLTQRDIRLALHLEDLADERVQGINARVRALLSGPGPRVPPARNELNHLRRDELVAWRDRPDPSLRERVVAHLASCDGCGGICAELVRTRPADTDPARFVPADFVPRACDLQRPRRSRRATLRRVLPLGVAALLAIVVLVPLLRTRADAPGRAVATRAGAIGGLQPSGDIDALTDFSWESSIPAYTYRLEVEDSHGFVVLSRTVASQRIEASAEIWRRFQPGEPYTWTVTALDASGAPLAASEGQAFRIRVEN